MFTKKRFLALTPQQQHRHCCTILKQAHDGADTPNKALEAYHEMQRWLGDDVPLPNTRYAIIDRFHHHLKQAGASLKEHNLLYKQSDRETGAAPRPIAIWLDRIRSAHNIGSIIRTTEAFRLGSLYFSPHMAFIDHKQVQDAAMHTHQWVASHKDVPLEQLPRPIVALETLPEAIPIHDYLFPESFTLAVGNEEYGLSPETIALADVVVTIPLRGRKNSLNVANAFAIAAAEIQRQANPVTIGQMS